MDWYNLIPAAVYILPLSWLFVRQTKMAERVDDTFTKEETEHLIDLKNKPIEVAIEHNTEVNKELVVALKELRQELHQLQKD